MWDSVGEGNSKLWTNTERGVANLLDGIYGDFEKLWTDIPSGTRTMANEVVGIVSRLVNWLTNSINTVIDGINKVPLIDDIPRIPQPSSPPTFAQGGFPDQGQMFIAREAGPELVGNIGGRTAVANNDQIVESVSAGVYSAVREAMGGITGQGGGQSVNFNLYLDGRQITNTVEQVQKERGLSLMGGSLSFA